jgi:hypothetical protein
MFKQIKKERRRRRRLERGKIMIYNQPMNHLKKHTGLFTLLLSMKFRSSISPEGKVFMPRFVANIRSIDVPAAFQMGG